MVTEEKINLRATLSQLLEEDGQSGPTVNRACEIPDSQ